MFIIYEQAHTGSLVIAVRKILLFAPNICVPKTSFSLLGAHQMAIWWNLPIEISSDSLWSIHWIKSGMRQNLSLRTDIKLVSEAWQRDNMRWHLSRNCHRSHSSHLLLVRGGEHCHKSPLITGCWWEHQPISLLVQCCKILRLLKGNPNQSTN